MENSVKKNKKAKRTIISICVILLITILGVVLAGMLYRFVESKKNQGNKEFDDAGATTITENSTLITEALYQDYQNGILTTDEYVRYSLYAVYDNSLLDEEYSSVNNTLTTIDPDKLVGTYQDELTEETLKYFFDQLQLKNISFELDKENEMTDNRDAFTDIFSSKVYAEERVITNLNKIVESSGGNFIVWYTTTGDSACDEEIAIKIAEGLEETVFEYEDLFDCEYKFVGEVYSKGDNYDNQVKVLESYGLSAERLEDTMQIYLVNYGDGSSLAQHMSMPPGMLELYYKLEGGDEYGSVANPYIKIRPSAMSDYETLEQLYNHELFHEFQDGTLTLDGQREINNDNVHMLEATANLASALVTEKTTTSGNLNIWSATAMRSTSDLMTDEFAEKYGENSVGYAMFVYLYNYSQIVPDGLNKIVDSLYEEDPFRYLTNDVYIDTQHAVQRETALKYLSKDYDNLNLVPDPEYTDDYGPKLIQDVNLSYPEKYENIDTTIAKLGIDYYKIENRVEEFGCEIKFVRENENVSAYLVGLFDGEYIILDSLEEGYELSRIFEPNLWFDADCYYLVVTNMSFSDEKRYAVGFYKTEPVEVPDFEEVDGTEEMEDTEDFDATVEIESDEVTSEDRYMSFNDLIANEGVDKLIYTYYYNDIGDVYKVVVTTIWLNEEEAQYNYEYGLENPTYKEVIKDGSTVTVVYTDEAAQELGLTLADLYQMQSMPELYYVEYIEFKPEM